MKIILLGAGSIGKIALHFIGYDRVRCFVDNNRFGEMEQGKNIISYSEMLEIIQKDDIIAITSDKYYEELERQVKKSGITNYFVFHGSDQWNMAKILPGVSLYGKWELISYTRCLGDYHINRYKKIAVLGTNEFLHYLLLELQLQMKKNSIVGIIGEKRDDIYTFGIPFVSLDYVWDSIDCLIINIPRTDSSIREDIENRSHTFDVVDIYKVHIFNNSFFYPKLRKYKNIHKGKRVFLIGNGPSLCIEDLNRLYKNEELCFGFNRIYRVYDKTRWRANYVGITDIDMIRDCYTELGMIGGNIFLGDLFFEDNFTNDLANVETIHLEFQEFYPNYPDFSDDISRGIYWGYSVTYDIGLQVAAYMGFEKIYLLGMDHSLLGSVADTRNHFISNYYKDSEKDKYNKRIFERDKLTKAYEKAELYSKTHGFRIYNATRGGELEIFERVDFDSLF